MSQDAQCAGAINNVARRPNHCARCGSDYLGVCADPAARARQISADVDRVQHQTLASLPDAADLVPLLESAGLGPELRQAEADMATLKAEQQKGQPVKATPLSGRSRGDEIAQRAERRNAPWPDHVRAAVDALEQQHDILLSSQEHTDDLHDEIKRLATQIAEITSLLDRYEIACDGGTITWPLVKRVRIACCAAVDESDAAYITALRAENAALVADNARLMGMLEGEP